MTNQSAQYVDAAPVQDAESELMLYSRSVKLSVEAGELFDFCASRAGFERQFPHQIDRYRGPADWHLGDNFSFRYKFGGLWLRWEGEFIEWDAGKRFVDEMKHGTFRRFIHTHIFERADAGTRYTDSIRFTLGLGRFVDRRIGLPMLDATFQKRHALLHSIFNQPSPPHQS